jgi:hypothetical protein
MLHVFVDSRKLRVIYSPSEIFARMDFLDEEFFFSLSQPWAYFIEQLFGPDDNEHSVRVAVIQLVEFSRILRYLLFPQSSRYLLLLDRNRSSVANVKLRIERYYRFGAIKIKSNAISSFLIQPPPPLLIIFIAFLACRSKVQQMDSIKMDFSFDGGSRERIK